MLALGPVPDERLESLEQAGLGGELPLVLGRQPRARRGSVGAGLGEVEPGQRRTVGLGHLAHGDREAPAWRRALDLDEVVQARWQRLPLLDVRRLAVGAGLAPPEDRRQRPRLDCGEPVRNGLDANDRHGRAHGLSRRERGVAATRDHDLLRAEERRDPERRQVDLELADRACVGVAAVRDRPERRLAVAPARGDDASVRACSRERRPLAGRQQVGVLPLHRAHRAQQRLVPLAPADPGPEDVLPDEDADAVQPRAVQLLGVVAVPAARVVEHVPLLEPARAQHARDGAVGEPLCPREVVVGGARERQRRLALERDPRLDTVERGPQARLRLLHRVEEDAVHAEVGDELRDREIVRDRLPPRADVPGVVVDEDAQAERLELRDELADPGDVAVVVELVAIVDTDHGICVPEHDPVEAAELTLRLRAEALGREAAGLVVEEKLVPEPGERDDVAAPRPRVLGRLVGGVVVADPGCCLCAPPGKSVSPGGPVGRIVRRDEDLGAVERLEVGTGVERDRGR